MRINLRQEIALWVLGLLWSGLGMVWLIDGLKETSQTRLTIAGLADLARQGIREQPQLEVTTAQINLLHAQMLLVVIFQVSCWFRLAS